MASACGEIGEGNGSQNGAVGELVGGDDRCWHSWPRVWPQNDAYLVLSGFLDTHEMPSIFGGVVVLPRVVENAQSVGMEVCFG